MGGLAVRLLSGCHLFFDEISFETQVMQRHAHMHTRLLVSWFLAVDFESGANLFWRHFAGEAARAVATFSNSLSLIGQSTKVTDELNGENAQVELLLLNSLDCLSRQHDP